MRLIGRLAAVLLPAALVLGVAGTAQAKPKAAPPVLTQKPANPTSATAATFAWTEATAGVTFSCQLDAAKAACTSPKSYSGLAQGTHTFKVTASRSGYIPGSTSYSWRIGGAPVAPTVAQVPTPTNSTSASVSWTDPDPKVTGYTCKLDSGAASACTSPKVLTGLTEGSHTLTVTARNALGLTASGSTSWVVDLTAPNAPVVTGPASPTKLQTADVTWTGNGDTYTCSLDGAAATACTSPKALSGLAEGPHTLVVTPKDAAGNVGPTGTATWVVDLTAPATPLIVSKPASPTNQTSATVRFADDDQSAVSFTCALDGAQASACTSPWTSSTVLGNGSHSLDIVASDLAGNTSPAATATWTVDTTAPTPPVFSSGPAAATNVALATFAFASGDPATVSYTCSLDGATAAPCASGAQFSVSTQGAHSLAVAAVNGLSTSSAPAVWNWVYDTVKPAAPTATGSTALGLVNTVPALAFTGEQGAALACQVDAGTAAPCSSPFTPAVTDGSHSVVVTATDAAGNASDATTFTFTLDSTKPTAAVSVPAGLLDGVTDTFSEDVQGVTAASVALGQAGNPVATALSCRSAANAVVACTGAVRKVVLTPTRPLIPGQHYGIAVSSAVHDAAGNAVAPVVQAFRASLLQQESSVGIIQAWRNVTTTAALGGRYTVADVAGATASYPFRGTAITWYGVNGPGFGVARVYVDGVSKGLVNTYAATTQYKVAHVVSGLSSGPIHRLQVVAAGAKGSTRGTGKAVALDAIKLGTTLLGNPAANYRWGVTKSSAASGGAFAEEELGGAVAAMVFRGTSLSWTTITGTTMGRAQVVIDGRLVASVDNYATSTHFGVKRTWALADGVHTVKIIVLGAHRAGGLGNRVMLDAFTVG